MTAASPNLGFLPSTHIKLNDNVLLKTPSGEVRSIAIKNPETRITLGKFGSFVCGELIGHPYGLEYEILGEGKLKVRQPESLAELEETDATNELISDGKYVQPLTYEEIEVLKHTPGIHSSEIVRKQIEQNANFSLRTEYSKDKYKKRKEAKYSQGFSVIEPTIFNICEYWFTKDSPRIKNIRAETLAQMMNFANVRPGARLIVVDESSGMLVASVLERMGGQGKILTINDSDSPPTYHIVSQLNLPQEVVSNMIISLNWATADENYVPIEPSTEPPDGEFRSDKQRNRLEKRKRDSQAFHALRNELFDGEWDGLLTISEYEPFSILEKLSPYLAGSAPIVVYSPHIQPLVEAHQKMRYKPEYLGSSITEAWLRQYQVLPGRTHPMMSMPGSGGYLLQAMKVYDDPTANAAASAKQLHRQAKRRRKLQEAEKKEALEAILDDSEDPTPGTSTRVSPAPANALSSGANESSDNILPNGTDEATA